MAIQCFIGIGMFCFALPEQLNIGPADISALRQVSGTGWTVYVDEKAKLRKAEKPAAPSQACNGDNCITYWRRCDDPAAPKQCVYFVEVGGEIHSLTLIADTEEHARTAIGAAAVYTKLPEPGPGRTMPPNIPISELNQEAGP